MLRIKVNPARDGFPSLRPGQLRVCLLRRGLCCVGRSLGFLSSSGYVALKALSCWVCLPACSPAERLEKSLLPVSRRLSTKAALKSQRKKPSGGENVRWNHQEWFDIFPPRGNSNQDTLESGASPASQLKQSQLRRS